MNIVEKTFFLRNMLCHCCLILLKEKLVAAGILVIDIRIGEVTLSINSEKEEKRFIQEVNNLGFSIIQGKDALLVEKIKQTVFELVHQLNYTNSIIRKSDYLVDKLGTSYQVLSKTFSHLEPITLEKYIILQKIEKIKELIDSEEYTLSEIAYMMDYSSVQYLSAQFKSITGLTPGEYKKSDGSLKKAVDRLY